MKFAFRVGFVIIAVFCIVEISCKVDKKEEEEVEKEDGVSVETTTFPGTSVVQYSILASQFIRPNALYFVSINVHDADQPTTIRVSIENDETPSYNMTQNVIVQPYSSITVHFDTGDMDPLHSTYRLVAEGLNGIGFNDETTIWLNEKVASTHVQTDRSEYVMGDTLRFRVLVLDSDSKPVNVVKDLTISLKDNKGSVVKIWKNESALNGVFTAETPIEGIDSHAGQWKLATEYRGNEDMTTIEVVQLVDSEFHVTIDTAADVVYSQKTITANIAASKNGKSVVGDISIRLASIFAHFHDGIAVVVKQKFTGDLIVEFNVADLQFEQEYFRELEFAVDVTETDTELHGNTTARVNIRTSLYYLVNLVEYNFAPGLPFTSVIQVFRHDKQPIEDLTRPIEITYSSNDAFDDDAVSKVFHLNEHGQVPWTIDVPPTFEQLCVKAKYEDLIEVIGIIPAAASPTNTFLQLKVVRNESNFDEEISVEVQSTDPLEWFTYQFIGRSGCFMAETVKVPNNDLRYDFKVKPDFRMFPSVKLIAFYPKDGSLVSAFTHLDFRHDFNNSITIEASPSKVKHDGELSLTVNTTPGSFVGLVAIDQTHNVRSAKAINADYIAYDLAQYNSLFYKSSISGQRIGYWVSDTEESVFTLHNTVVISNFIEPFSRRPVYEEATPAGNVQPKDILLRNQFELAETWLWDNINVSSENEVHKIKVPSAQKSWKIAAFAVHPEAGFGIVRSEVSVKVV